MAWPLELHQACLDFNIEVVKLKYRKNNNRNNVYVASGKVKSRMTLG